LKRRSIAAFRFAPILLLTVSFLLTSCGQNFFFAGRNLPPSGLLNRVLIAEQNPSALSQGALPFVDAFYDIRHPFNASTGTFSISGYSGKLPVTIQNMPEEQTGAVYGEGDGSFVTVNYQTEKIGTPITIPGGLSTSIFIDRPRKYVYAANPASHVISVADLTAGKAYELYLPNAYWVSVNPGGTIAMAFVQNSTQAENTQTCNVNKNIPCSTPNGQFSAYSVVHLTAAQQTAAANNPYYQGAQDCEPQNLPQFCLFPVSTGASATFDHPVKAVFSPDGSTVYVVNCGPECGGTTASLAVIPITTSSLNPNTVGASGIALQAQSNIPIPGGATNAIFNGNTMYVAGQQIQSDGLLAGNLTVLSTLNNQISGSYPISDGAHTKMVFADDNTLWVGSTQCQSGERFKQVQAGVNEQYGCLTMFNTSNNSVFVDAYKGDATGIAAVTGLTKVYTAEGGQVHIYNTTDGSERDNSNVTVAGTVADVAYMDATSDGDNTDY
jgi:hypothetical protein